MKWPVPAAPLPLLRKELVEQSARRRTYLVRVAYAAVLFTIFLAAFADLARYARGNPWSMLGRGREMFAMLVGVQFGGIYLFLPALMSGVLTAEKERGSLGLLFLTRLKPWEIVLEKYLGRLVPMFTFLLLSLPLLAVCYAYGGISPDYLLCGAWVLVLTCLQVGAWSLMLSCFCRTTVQAFLCSYLLGLLLYFGPVLMATLLLWLLEGHTYGGHDLEETLFILFPVYVFSELSTGWDWVAGSVPILVSTLIFLALARAFVVRRAFVQPRNRLRGVFRRLDAFWERLNSRLGGIFIVREPDTLPEDRPVAWREVSRKSLGKVSYLFRVLVLVEVPTLCMAGVVLVEGSFRGECQPLELFAALLWVLGVLALAAASANAVVSERADGTLDVLLVTPIRGRELVLQKMRGIRRLALVMAMPLVTTVCMEAWVEPHLGSYDSGHPPLAYVACSVLFIALFFSLVAWLGMWVSMRSRTRARAIIGTLVILACWCGLPLLLVWLIAVAELAQEEVFGYLSLLSPAFVVALLEVAEGAREVFGRKYLLVPAVVSLVGYGGVWLVLRSLCLRRADAYLGRIPEPSRRRAAPVEEGGASEGAC
jgi:ABC-type transport system involved in multi-copper enzyme maturation permease subunit